MRIIKTLLTISILLISINAFSQFQFDSVQVKKIRLVIEENAFLKVENDSLVSKVDYLKRAGSVSELIISMQDSIILNKEKQIKKLESIPQTVVQENKTKWYVFAGIIISSVSAGIITGLIIK